MIARTTAKMRAHLEHFSGVFPRTVPTTRRFVAEALYGIAALEDPISGERPVPLDSKVFLMNQNNTWPTSRRYKLAAIGRVDGDLRS